MKNITQSLIKDLQEYSEKKICGLQIKAKYYDSVTFETSDAQLLGQWFEYKATGQKDRFGNEPIPPKLKSGKLPKKYTDILEHIEPFNKTLEENDFEIIETGKRIELKGLQGDIDLILKDKKTNKIAFGDIKTSGLINDKWNKFGWDEESLQFKHHLLLQAIHYKLLGHLEYGYEPDFYFFIFSSTNNYDRKVLKIILNNERIEQHFTYIERIFKIKLEVEKNGFKAYPEPKICSKCPVKDTCSEFTDTPIIKEIYY
tara:strand:+ start:717 stop:1487 length:771 start_codon:yes stop_codon:yes gene_type:complete